MKNFYSSGWIQTAVKPFSLLLTLVCLGSTSAIAANESSLQRWASHLQKSAIKIHPQVAVTALHRRTPGKDFLAFKLTNISKQTLKIPAPYLPWGNLNSIKFATITTDGKELPISLSIDDIGTFQTITLAPGASRQGDYELTQWIDFSKAKGKDVLVFWSYAPPFEPRHPGPVCTGVVVIPKVR